METPFPCRACGLHIHIHARGYCDACYVWQQRHGWDARRPTPPTHCADCGRPFASCGGHRARGRCTACYWRAWRAT